METTGFTVVIERRNGKSWTPLTKWVNHESAQNMLERLQDKFPDKQYRLKPAKLVKGLHNVSTVNNR